MAELLTENNETNKPLLLVKLTAWTAMVIFAFHACTHMVAAGDTWVAMACGRHFVNHGVDTVEPFSFNSHNAGPADKELEDFPEWLHPAIKKWHPTGWINQNWLTQVIFYELATGVGSEQQPAYNMLVFWKFAINLVVIVCMYFSARLLGAERLISAAMVCAAMFVSRSFIDIRPAVFSNAIVPLYIYLLLLAAYRKTAFIYLLIPLLIFWGNVHGGYLYAFIILAPYWLYFLAASKFKWKSLTPPKKGLAKHTFLAGLFSFIAMVIFNPYHLTNLTHTFIITVSEHAKEWKNVNEWHSSFELDNPVGESMPFLIIFFAGLAVMAAWGFIWLTKPSANKRNIDKDAVDNRWFRLPALYIFIAIFTCVMALRSRRFIPIAVYTLAPLLAIMLTQMRQMISLKANLAKRGKAVITEVNPKTIKTASVVMLAVSIVFGVFCVSKFHKIYIQPWPIDSEKTSVFMRMTASYAKPFKACEFIRANALSGRMLNYWTEGGFVAYGQVPDEQTGEIPLKIFMDGRAQAAYDIEMFHEYNRNILSGGKLGRELAALSRKPDVSKQRIQEKLSETAEYLEQKLASYNVWVVLMPANQQRSIFMKALTSLPNWKMVYTDKSQILLTNTDDDRGSKLFQGVFSGDTVFPDENYRKIVKAAYYASARPQQAYELAYDAFEATGSSNALNYLFNTDKTEDLQNKVYDFAKSIVSDFITNKNAYKKEDGFAEKQANVIMALDYIRKNADRREPGKVKTYSAFAQQLSSQRSELMKEYNW